MRLAVEKEEDLRGLLFMATWIKPGSIYKFREDDSIIRIHPLPLGDIAGGPWKKEPGHDYMKYVRGEKDGSGWVPVIMKRDILTIEHSSK